MKLAWVIDSNGCWIVTSHKPSILSGGYPRVQIGKSKVAAHRIIWTRNYGPIPDEMCVCQHCDNRMCINPTHLFLGTRSDNNHDRDMKGRSRGGRLNAQFDDEEISHIRYEKKAVKAMADQYGVTVQAIYAILKRKTYKHLN